MTYFVLGRDIEKYQAVAVVMVMSGKCLLVLLYNRRA